MAQTALLFFSREVWLFSNPFLLSALCFVSLLLFLGALVSFKKRKRQILLNNINIFINALLTGLLVIWLLSLSGGDLSPKKGIELAFPLFSFVMLFLANKYIKKDEKLVKSVDRIR